MSHPPCCPAGSWGPPLDTPAIKSPNSNCVTLESDLDLYVVKPTNCDGEKKAILVFPDVYGFQNRLFAICNKLSNELQCYIVAVDNFRGETKDDHPNDFFEWTSRHPFDGAKDVSKKICPVKNDIDACFAYLNGLGVSKDNVSAIGFCWGAWPITRQCTTDEPFKCIVGFHPSLVFEDRSGGVAVSLVKAAVENTPILYFVAGNDADYLKPGGDVEKVLAGSKFSGNDLGSRSRCVQFTEMSHGWVSRGNTNLEKVKDDAEKALRFASDFLRHWM